MKNVLAFLIIHAPFLVSSFIFLKAAKDKRLTPYIYLLLSLMYGVTILSSIGGMGDDFAWFHYFFMYALVPLIFFYCKSGSYKSYGRCAVVSIFIVFPLLAVSGVITLILSLFVAFPDFR